MSLRNLFFSGKNISVGLFLLCWLIVVCCLTPLLVCLDRKSRNRRSMAESVQPKKCQRKVSEYFASVLRSKKKPIYYEVLRSYLSGAPNPDIKSYVKRYCKGEELLHFFQRRNNWFSVSSDNHISVKWNAEIVSDLSEEEDIWKVDRGVSPAKQKKQGKEAILCQKKFVCSGCNLLTEVSGVVRSSGLCAKCESKQQSRASIWALSSSSSSLSSIDEVETEQEVLNYFIDRIQEVSPCFSLRDVCFQNLPKNVKAYLRMKYASDKVHRFFLDHCKIFHINDDGFVNLVTDDEPGVMASKENIGPDEGHLVVSQTGQHAHRKKKKKVCIKENSNTLSRSELLTIKFFVGVLENKHDSVLTLHRLRGHLSQSAVEVRNFIKCNYPDKSFKKFFTGHQKIFKLSGCDVTLTKTYASQLLQLEEVHERPIENDSILAVDNWSEKAEPPKGFNLRPEGTKLVNLQSNRKESKFESCIVDKSTNGTIDPNDPKFSSENITKNDSELTEPEDSKSLNGSSIRNRSVSSEVPNLELCIEQLPKNDSQNSLSEPLCDENYLSCESINMDNLSESSDCYFSLESGVNSPTSCKSAFNFSDPLLDTSSMEAQSQKILCSTPDSLQNTGANGFKEPLDHGRCRVKLFEDTNLPRSVNSDCSERKFSKNESFSDKCSKFVAQMKKCGLFNNYYDCYKLEENLKLQIGQFLWSLELFCLEHIFTEKHSEQLSVEYFATQLMDFKKMNVCSLKGKLGQAPPEVSAYINRKFPGANFLQFFHQHSEFYVSGDNVLLLKSQNSSETALQKPSQLYYSDNFVEVFYRILKTIMKFLLVLKKKGCQNLSYIASVMDNEQRDVLKALSGHKDRGYKDRLREYFSLFSGMFDVVDEKIKVTAHADVYLQLAIETALFGKFCSEVKNKQLVTNDKIVMEECMQTLNCFPEEFIEFAKLNDLHSKVLQKCDGCFYFICSYYGNVVLNNFVAYSDEDSILVLKTKGLNKLLRFLASNSEGITYSNLPTLFSKGKDVSKLMMISFPGFLLPDLESEQFVCKGGKIFLGKDIPSDVDLSCKDFDCADESQSVTIVEEAVPLASDKDPCSGVESEFIDAGAGISESSKVELDSLVDESDCKSMKVFTSLEERSSSPESEVIKNCSDVDLSYEDLDRTDESQSVTIVEEAVSLASEKEPCSGVDTEFVDAEVEIIVGISGGSKVELDSLVESDCKSINMFTSPEERSSSQEADIVKKCSDADLSCEDLGFTDESQSVTVGEESVPIASEKEPCSGVESEFSDAGVEIVVGISGSSKVELDLLVDESDCNSIKGFTSPEKSSSLEAETIKYISDADSTLTDASVHSIENPSCEVSVTTNIEAVVIPENQNAFTTIEKAREGKCAVVNNEGLIPSMTQHSTLSTIIYDRDSDSVDYEMIFSCILSCYSRFVCRNIDVPYNVQDTQLPAYEMNNHSTTIDNHAGIPDMSAEFTAPPSKTKSSANLELNKESSYDLKNGLVAPNYGNESNHSGQVDLDTDYSDVDNEQYKESGISKVMQKVSVDKTSDNSSSRKPKASEGLSFVQCEIICPDIDANTTSAETSELYSESATYSDLKGGGDFIYTKEKIAGKNYESKLDFVKAGNTSFPQISELSDCESASGLFDQVQEASLCCGSVEGATLLNTSLTILERGKEHGNTCSGNVSNGFEQLKTPPESDNFNHISSLTDSLGDPECKLESRECSLKETSSEEPEDLPCCLQESAADDKEPENIFSGSLESLSKDTDSELQGFCISSNQNVIELTNNNEKLSNGSPKIALDHTYNNEHELHFASQETVPVVQGFPVSKENAYENTKFIEDKIECQESFSGAEIQTSSMKTHSKVEFLEEYNEVEVQKGGEKSETLGVCFSMVGELNKSKGILRVENANSQCVDEEKYANYAEDIAEVKNEPESADLDEGQGVLSEVNNHVNSTNSIEDHKNNDRLNNDYGSSSTIEEDPQPNLISLQQRNTPSITEHLTESHQLPLVRKCKSFKFKSKLFPSSTTVQTSKDNHLLVNKTQKEAPNSKSVNKDMLLSAVTSKMVITAIDFPLECKKEMQDKSVGECFEDTSSSLNQEINRKEQVAGIDATQEVLEDCLALGEQQISCPYFARIILLTKEACIAEIRCAQFEKAVYCASRCFQCQLLDSCEASQVLSVGDLIRCDIISPNPKESMWIAKCFTTVSPHKCSSTPACEASIPPKNGLKACVTSLDSADAQGKKDCCKMQDLGVQVACSTVDAATQTVSSGSILHSSFLPKCL